MAKRKLVSEAAFDVVAIRDIKRLANRLVKKIATLEKAFVKRAKSYNPKASDEEIRAAFEMYERGAGPEDH